MTLQPSTRTTSATWTKIGLALLIAVAIVAMMLLLNVIFGVQGSGPFYDIVPDPAAWAGLPF